VFNFNTYKLLLHKIGLLSDQRGIYRRYCREARNWESHLENSRKQIVEFCNSKNNKSVAILGSGWLLDVPLEYLASRFADVYLFDIWHPRKVRREVKNFTNVHLVERDLTGGVIAKISTLKANNLVAEITHCQMNGLPEAESFDVVVSLNLLSQIDSLLIDYLSEKTSLTDEDLLEIRQVIQQQHVNSLPVGKSLLISDYLEMYESLYSDEKKQKKLIHIFLPQTRSEWLWNFDTKGLYSDGYNVKMKVGAWLL
jgi:hypothetical protein